MSFRDYSITPASNTALGDGTYIGPNMLRNKVRPALQQIAADGKELADDVDAGFAALPSTPAGDISRMATRALLAADAGAVFGATRLLIEAGRMGLFVAQNVSTWTAVIAADSTTQGVSVPSAFNAAIVWMRVDFLLDRPLNVRWFGAVGDRSTNDYAAIQGAINVVLAAGGGTVYLPGGKWYRLTTGLVVTSAVDAIVPICIEGGPASFLEAITGIDMLTISNTGVAPANTRCVTVKNLGFVVNDASARGLVLSNASYNQFTGLDMLGSGTMIVCGSALDNRNVGNQFDNILITQPGNGIYITGFYNIFTNIEINEGITGAYAILFHGQNCVVDGFVARGAGGTGGTATIVMDAFSAFSTLANGTVFDSYAVGIDVTGGAFGQRVKGVVINNSQFHGLQLSGSTQAEIDVTIANSSLATANTYNHINCLNTPTDCSVRAQFIGTQALLDINEANGTNNVWICGTLPNGKTISGTGSVVVSAGNIRGASFNVGATQVFDSAGALTTPSVAINGGTPLTKDMVYAPSITPASVAAATVAEQTFTVNGLTTADKVIVNPPSISNATGIAGARVSAADTLAIRFVNPTAGALTPTSGTYTVLAFRS